ncbi:hypothetical protein JL108_14470 [Aeromicrobium sp. YIM 150415]|uniref:hypothetical protein n=1 Tax=Aeromicrobium sp. YIM 150415 TaxID=2803912 RepID=UPI001965AC20|nr:hypothetical protein [Aeromicrobium sp. YIM 150415]MBM9464658.1 hypothetical protein [Aeromicrobium sp. YIM 150415]
MTMYRIDFDHHTSIHPREYGSAHDAAEAGILLGRGPGVVVELPGGGVAASFDKTVSLDGPRIDPFCEECDMRVPTEWVTLSDGDESGGQARFPEHPISRICEAKHIIELG